jgi:hypothetical protein
MKKLHGLSHVHINTRIRRINPSSVVALLVKPTSYRVRIMTSIRSGCSQCFGNKNLTYCKKSAILLVDNNITIRNPAINYYTLTIQALVTTKDPNLTYSSTPHRHNIKGIQALESHVIPFVCRRRNSFSCIVRH